MYSGSRAEENAALYVSAWQLSPAPAKDLAALPCRLPGWDVSPDRKGLGSRLCCHFAIPAPKQLRVCSAPGDGQELHSLLGRHLYLMYFLPLMHAKGSTAQWTHCEWGKLDSVCDHSVSLDSFSLPSVQMNNESGLSFPFRKP